MALSSFTHQEDDLRPEPLLPKPNLMPLSAAAPQGVARGDSVSSYFIFLVFPVVLVWTQPSRPVISTVHVTPQSVTSKTDLPLLRCSLICLSCAALTGCQSLPRHTEMRRLSAFARPTEAVGDNGIDNAGGTAVTRRLAPAAPGPFTMQGEVGLLGAALPARLSRPSDSTLPQVAGLLGVGGDSGSAVLLVAQAVRKLEVLAELVAAPSPSATSDNGGGAPTRRLLLPSKSLIRQGLLPPGTCSNTGRHQASKEFSSSSYVDG